MRRRALALHELQRAVRCTPEELLALLAEEADRGNVERVGDRWMLTRRAERAHGRALRSMEPW